MTNRNKVETKVTEMSIVSISIFAAICLALMAVLMTRADFQIGLNAYSLASGALLLAVVLFILSNDFFLLTIFYTQNEVFSITGSILYGLGEASMIVGISWVLKALATYLVAYLFLSVFTLGFLVYNGIRFWQVGKEAPVKTRIIFRAVNLLILTTGYIMIWWMS